jgi:hypothetical protein
VRLLVGILSAAVVWLASSPSPADGSVPARLPAIGSVVRHLEHRVELMEWSAARYADWEACIRGVPVGEYGDPDRRFGYAYDERDGTGPGYMPALAVDRKSRPRREDYLFLTFSRKGGCRSDAPLPGGTADPASVRPRDTLPGLERRVRAMKRSARRLLRVSERFDEWESCVSWVPVTEYGDPAGKFGYAFGPLGRPAAGYRPALAIDRSDWDDPEYMFLAFVGGDRPGRGCQDEPGESIDSLAAALPATATADRAGDLEQELDSLSEEIEDLEEPVAEFDQFDECMYLIGVSAYGRRDGAFGYHFGTHGRARRPALALDLRPSSRPRYRFLAFPGEEPPSIECNEDAGEEIVDN